MARKSRFGPEGGALVEVTWRAEQARLLLLPSAELNDIILGVLGRAQRLFPVRLGAYVFLSNDFDLLLDVDDAQEPALFMAYFNSNLAREIARRTDREDKILGLRYQAIVVSDEEPAQVAGSRTCSPMAARKDSSTPRRLARRPLRHRLAHRRSRRGHLLPPHAGVERRPARGPLRATEFRLDREGFPLSPALPASSRSRT